MPVYQIVGFTLDSPIELPNLSELMTETSTIADLTIKVGDLPLFTCKQPHQSFDGGEIQWINGGFRLFHPRVGEILLLENTIYWQPVNASKTKGFRTFLLNTIIPAYTMLKGMLPLHISAVSVAGKAIAFQGNSGAGKSTLAAMLMQRGYPVLTEDLGIIELNDKTAIMRAGVPYFRLWKKTLKQLNETPQQQNRAWQHTGKFYRAIEADNFCSQPQPIRAIYFLHEPEHGNEISIKAITGFKAAKALMHSIFFGIPQNSINETEQIFKKTMALAHQTKCFELIRPKNFDIAEQVIDTLVNHWKTF